MSEIIGLMINGVRLDYDSDPQQPLLHVLRDRFGLTGSKIGCGEGECGVCTVLIDDQPVRSCVTPVGTVAGKRVLTIEGLAQGDQLHPLQQAFLDCDALQCGYCTAGMIMSGVGLLMQCPEPSEAEIVGFMQGNICRCGTYPRIVSAIQQAAEELQATVPGGQA